MANEKKNGTLEEIIMEMLKEGKAAFLFLKCERPFDFNFFLGNDLPGRICERHRTASLYSFSITESSDRSQRIFGKMILIRPMINARLA